jgi:predicted ATP-grasp superfamily ATP-dependent carboligase
MARAGGDFDRSTPLALLKVGAYPLHHGTLGAARSLGRVGVPVYAMVEDRVTPTAVSRYVRRCFVEHTTGLEARTALLTKIKSIGERIGRPSVAVATDDETAVLLAEYASELSQWFLLPKVDSELPRQLACKRDLNELCRSHGVATPAAEFITSQERIDEYARTGTFPVVAKCVEPFVRLQRRALRDPVLVHSGRELRELSGEWGDEPSVLIQEYLPPAVCQDWIVHSYVGGGAESSVMFTGVKYRSWPAFAGPTSYARAVRNDRLSDLATGFCRSVGYQGLIDMDWRYDERDDTYKLLDCNPRLGAQFRLFETDAGIDLVRALHLDMTGRAIPPGAPVDGRGYVVEHYDARAYWSYRRAPEDRAVVPHGDGPVELSWLAWDDPLPVLSLATRLLPRAAAKITRLATGRSGERPPS